MWVWSISTPSIQNIISCLQIIIHSYSQWPAYKLNKLISVSGKGTGSRSITPTTSSHLSISGNPTKRNFKSPKLSTTPTAVQATNPAAHFSHPTPVCLPKPTCLKLPPVLRKKIPYLKWHHSTNLLGRGLRISKKWARAEYNSDRWSSRFKGTLIVMKRLLGLPRKKLH